MIRPRLDYAALLLSPKLKKKRKVERIQRVATKLPAALRDHTYEERLEKLGLMTEVVEKCRQRPHITTGQLLEHWRDTKTEALLARLASWDIPVAENQQELFYDSLDKILAQCVDKQIEQLLIKERNVGLSGDEKRELVALMLELKA